jgi:hypothetical protein
MNKTLDTPPNLNPDWTEIGKLIIECLSGIGVIGWIVDRFFRHVTKVQIDKNQLLKFEKEEYVKGIVSANIAPIAIVVQEISQDIKELKQNRETDMKYLNDHLIKIISDSKK